MPLDGQPFSAGPLGLPALLLKLGLPLLQDPAVRRKLLFGHGPFDLPCERAFDGVVGGFLAQALILDEFLEGGPDVLVRGHRSIFFGPALSLSVPHRVRRPRLLGEEGVRL